MLETKSPTIVSQQQSLIPHQENDPLQTLITGNRYVARPAPTSRLSVALFHYQHSIVLPIDSRPVRRS